MNKLLYFITTLFVLTSATLCHAQGGVSYGYSSDDIIGHGFNATDKYWIAAAFQMTESDVAQFDGCEVTGVSIGFGSGRNKDIKVFMTEDLAAEPFYSQAGRVRASQWCDIPVTTPVKIEKGKPFYIGYVYFVDNMTSQPIGADGNTASFTPGADWMAAAMDEDGLKEAWAQYGTQVGNVCIRAMVSGDNLSKSNCVPVALGMPELATPGEPFDFTLSFTNASSVAVSNLDIVYQLGTDAEQAVHYEFTEPVATNDRGTAVIHATTLQDELEIPVWARIDKVNGLPNDMADRKAYGNLVCTTNLFERKVVVEKFSGTSCGYCPRGIAGFDHMNDLYAGQFIGIAVQNYSAYDPMYCTYYNAWCNKFSAGGAPYCYVNRDDMLTKNPEKGSLEAAFKAEFSRTSNIGIKVSVKATANPMAYDATATVRVARNVENADLSVAFVVTEDFVGPYAQQNYYNSTPGCPEFSGVGNPVVMRFNDVARYITTDWQGIAGSVPANLTAGEEYSYTFDGLSLGNTGNPKNANVIALLIDNKTSKIVNADRVHLDPNRVDEPTVGMAQPSLGSQKLTATGGEGRITVESAEGTALVFTSEGKLAAVLHAGEAARVTAGTYIVKTPGESQKVIVK